MAKDQQIPAIQTRGLTKIFCDFWGRKRVIAVESLDLEISRRQVYGLLGPNGSGKSTTIKILLGLLFPTRGMARVLGRLPGDLKANQRIGYLPEESHLYPFLSARETLDFYGRLFGLPQAERRRRIDSLLDMVGLSGVGNRPMGEFSKGMARRLGLAQALINDPELLILDEPTSGLDPIGTRQIKDLILHLGKRGKTVLLCSHLLADVEDVCDCIGILYGGKMQAEGQVDNLLARKEMTQIRTGLLSEGALTRIKEIIQQDNQRWQLEIQTPRDRLEDFFLRTVEQARSTQMETSGALMGTGISAFLGTTESKVDEAAVLIEKLVTGAKPPGAEGATKVEKVEPFTLGPTAEEWSRKQILASLIQVDTAPAGSKVAPEESAAQARNATGEQGVPPAKGEQDSRVDEPGGEIARSVIDELMTGSEARKIRKPPKGPPDSR